MIICVDFDGTIVKHAYPLIGQPVPLALEKLREFNQNGHKIILFTMRSGKELLEAVNYVEHNAGFKLFGINTNPQQKSWTSSPKAYGHIYIDDAAYGCPLVHAPNVRPYVDWSKINI